jgi:hypothetical protein
MGLSRVDWRAEFGDEKMIDDGCERGWQSFFYGKHADGFDIKPRRPFSSAASPTGSVTSAMMRSVDR